MYYRLRQGLAFCFAGDAVIFLDAKAGRYFGASRQTRISFSRLISQNGRIAEEGDRNLSTLISRGYLVENPLPVDFDSPPVQDLADDLGPRHLPSTPISLVLLAVLWQLLIKVRLQTSSLDTLLDGLSSRRLIPLPAKFDTSLHALRVSAAFRKAAIFLEATDRCLVQSLAMFAMLKRRGVPCRFAIGVRTRPFKAHSWVEFDTLVLNDDIENVLRFTPILVVK